MQNMLNFKPFKAYCCHMGTAIKHPVPDRLKPSFVIFDIRALWRSYSCTHMATVGFKGLNWRTQCQYTGTQPRRNCQVYQYISSVQCESKKSPPHGFLTFFPKRLGIFNQFLHTYYAFLYTLDYKFLFSYLQLWRSYAILSETTHRIFTFH